MARYLLVQVDENERAEQLREKLDGVEGIDVIGVFAKPTRFCECENYEGVSVKGKTKGWYVCPECRYPRDDAIQHPVNLMDAGVPAEYRNVFLTIREPYMDPYQRTGRYAILKKLESIQNNARKLKRRKTRRPRARR